MSRPAHRLSAKSRTSDVTVSEDVTFAGLLLSEPVLQGLKRAGFERPSPIQLRAIPLGRCAVDLIVQAKSGTGKTCVLAVLALETLVSAPPSGRCRALVLAPTREVAVQVAQVITAIGAHVPGLSVHSLIGGLPLAQDVANLRRCNVAVGTPGRVRQLVDCGALNTDSVRLFVMDEADKLMEDAFVDDINFIYSTLPASKQMIALSATYPESLADLLARYMRSPTFVRLGKTSPALLGIRQYVMTVAHEPLVTKQLKLKLDALLDVLSTVSFTQCLVFSNHQTRAETLCSQLSARGWPSAHLSSSLTQERRLEALSQLTALRCRVLVTTDLGARGVDSEHADLVVQLDVPWDGATYLHRVGRAGRYGSLGAAIALVSRGEEERRLTTVLAAAGVRPLLLPATLPADLKTCNTDGWQTYGGDGGAGHGGGDGAEGKTGQVRSNGHSASPEAAESRAGTGRRRGSPPVESGAGEHAASSGGGGGEGRKTLVARRRQPPGPPSAEQRQDRARLEAATDGWTRAVTSRGRPPVAAAAAAAPAAVEPARPSAAPAGDSSGRTERTEASGDEGSDSDDSQDSFQAMLRAYKRDQQRRAADEARAGSDGHQGTQSEETGEKVTPEETRSGETNQKVTSSGEGKRMSMNGVENKDSKDTTPSAAHQERAESSAPGEAVGAVTVDSDPGSDAELSAPDEEALRHVLRKLTPRLVGSLTEEELQRTLAPYLTARRRAGCRLYRRAVALVRQKGVRRALQLALGSGGAGQQEEVGLSELLERLCVVEPPPPAAAPPAVKVPPAAPAQDSRSGARRAESGRPSPRLVNGHTDRTSRTSDPRADVSSRGEAVVRKPKVSGAPAAAQGASVDVRDSSQQRSPGPKGASAATCTASSAIGAVTYSASPAARAVVDYDEEVLQMPNREEDVEAFQRDLRLSAAHKKALRASGRSAGRQKSATAADSSSSESSSASEDNIPPQKPVRSARAGRSAARQHQTSKAQSSAATAGAAAQASEGESTGHRRQSNAHVYGESYADRASGAAAAWDWSHGYHQPPWSQWRPYDSGAYLPQSSGAGWWGDSAAHPPVYGTAPGWGGGWAPQTARPPQHPPRTWDELLNMCYDQQSRYLAHMSAYYAQYHGRTQT